MKKIFAYTLFLLLLVAGNAFAEAIDNQPVHPVVLQAFKKDFRNAINPAWTEIENAYRVSFTKDDMSYTAYYSQTGELSATTRIITYQHLPLVVLKSLLVSYSTENISSIFEYNIVGETTFYIVRIVNEKTTSLLKYYPDGQFEVKQKNRIRK